MIFFYLALVFLGVLYLRVFIFKFIEPLYMMVFNKPMYLYLYPLPKKLSSKDQLFLEDEYLFYANLSPKKKRYFDHRVNEFINYYQFIGKEEILITDEMKLSIAGTYVMLTFGLRNYLIDLFKTIIIYPEAYYSNVNKCYHKGEFNPIMKAVVFSWKDFVLGNKITNDNLNLGLHEFSHVLHFHGMKSNDPNAQLFHDEFYKLLPYYKDEALNKKIIEKNYFRDYAFENPFEFVAVILEYFFETPQQFKSHFPELFQHVCVMINFNENNFSDKTN